MSSYVGRHAELYDIFYADKPYAQEAAFVDVCLRELSQHPVERLLELACGTGRHALEFEKRGYQVAALDYSPDMIQLARRRGETAGSRVAFDCDDMRSFDLKPKPWDAAVCLFDSIGYVETNEAVQQVLRNVHRHLRPGGMFVFEFWHGAAMLRGYDPTRVRRWPSDHGEIVRISETKLNCARQLCEVTYTIFEPGPNGAHTRLAETQTNRFFLVQEMSQLLESCEFSPVKWFAGFTADERITPDTWHIVAVAQRID